MWTDNRLPINTMPNQPTNLVRCHPDPARLEPFRDMVEAIPPLDPYFYGGVAPPCSDEWGMGNIWRRAVVYTCGHLTRDDALLDHWHEPEEMAFCERIANEAVSRLSRFIVSEGGPIGPFFAAAVVGEPVPERIDESVVRRAFGGALAPGLLYQADRLSRQEAGHWNQLDCIFMDMNTMPPEVVSAGDFMGYVSDAWDEFAEWFVGVPGLREHTVIGVGYSDDDPGVLKPRLLLALTEAGSLVGVISYVAHA